MSLKTLILKNHTQLEHSIENIIHHGLELIRSKLYLLNNEKKNLIIEGLLLRECAYWEKFIEIEVVYLVEIDQNKIIREFDLPSNVNLNRRVIKAMLFSNTYKSFHDIERSMSFFKTYIAGNFNLFNDLTKDQLKKTLMLYTLRNYLAHYSEFSEKKLRQEYRNTYGYSKFMQPGKFLTKDAGKHFEGLVHNFSLMSAKMRSSLK